MSSARITFDRWAGHYADRIAGARTSAVRDLFAAASRPDMISFSGGMPDVRRIPHEQVAKAAQEAVMEYGATALQYGGSEGRFETREIVAELMAEVGVRVKPEDIVITSGAQQALDLLGKTFINPGDVIITEGPTYVGALQAFSAYQPDIHCVPLDDQGMRMDLLEEELKRLGHRGAKFIYTIPNFHNPAGVTMTSARRDRLIELAREYDIPVVEDDPYGRLRFEGGHQRPLRARDDEVIYLGTFSKIFAPGLRLGWVIAPAPILSKILLVKQGSDLCGSAFAQVTAERYFRGSQWRKTLQNLTKVYGERRDAMFEALEEYFPAEARWTHPEGGFFVWVELPPYVDTNLMVAEAIEHGVVYVSGTGFYPRGEGANCMRLSFCYPSTEDIREGIRRLGEVIDARLELYRAFIAAGAIAAPETGRE